jgi:serine/threonine protein kinase
MGLYHSKVPQWRIFTNKSFRESSFSKKRSLMKLRGLLEINPKKRITIKQMYEHPWLQDVDQSLEIFT